MDVTKIVVMAPISPWDTGHKDTNLGMQARDATAGKLYWIPDRRAPGGWAYAKGNGGCSFQDQQAFGGGNTTLAPETKIIEPGFAAPHHRELFDRTVPPPVPE